MSDSYQSRDSHISIAKRLAGIKSGPEIPLAEFDKKLSCSEDVEMGQDANSLSFPSKALRGVLSALMDSLADYERETSEIISAVKAKEEEAQQLLQSTKEEIGNFEAGLSGIEALFSIRDGGWEDTEERLKKLIEDARRERLWFPDAIVRVMNYELTEILGYRVDIDAD